LTTIVLAFGLVLPPLPQSTRSALPHAVRAGRLVLGWGPDPIWSDLEIATIDDAAEGLKAITVAAPDAVEGYTTGGQYVLLRDPGAEKGAPIAIASAPSAGSPLEFLVKEQPPSDWSPGTGWLTGASAGSALQMSQVMGSGFLKTADALEGMSDVLLFAVGSGISPIRATIESGALKGKKAHLYFGCRTPELMSYQDKFDAWREMGVDVTPVISQPDGTGWEGATGYVQDVAAGAGVDAPKSTAILVCGTKGMFEGVKDFAADNGVPEDKILSNF